MVLIISLKRNTTTACSATHAYMHVTSVRVHERHVIELYHIISLYV